MRSASIIAIGCSQSWLSEFDGVFGMARNAMAEQAVPVASGEQEFQVTVTVTYSVQ